MVLAQHLLLLTLVGFTLVHPPWEVGAKATQMGFIPRE